MPNLAITANIVGEVGLADRVISSWVIQGATIGSLGQQNLQWAVFRLWDVVTLRFHTLRPAHPRSFRRLLRDQAILLVST